MLTNELTPELLAKYRVYVKIKPIFLRNLKKATPKQTIQRLISSVWEVKTINNDANTLLVNSISLEWFYEIVGYKCSIFADEVKVVKIERLGGKLF